MWWYRDKSAPESDAPAEATAPDALTRALRAALAGRAAEPAPVLAMSLLVDSRIELSDGTIVEGPSWFDAERCVEVALQSPKPLRLYNEFSKEYGDGYSRRDDLPEKHRKLLDALRAALLADPGVASISPA